MICLSDSRIMETLEELSKCQICGKSGHKLSIYVANHKDLGLVEICRDCWTKFYRENRLVAGSGSKNCDGCCRCSF